MCKEAAKEPAKAPVIEEIDTLPDLLLFIQLNNNPREIREVVARFMMNPSLSENDRDLIRKKVMEKISAERKKRSRPNDEAEEGTKEEGLKESGREMNSGEDMMDTDAIDFESLNKLSSFVGEGAQELLKQVSIASLQWRCRFHCRIIDLKAGEDVESPTAQPSTPPPLPPALTFTDQDEQDEPSADVDEVIKGDRKSISEILPGPPPVPPVYGDSSDGESPPERDDVRSPDSSSFSKIQTVNVLPVPPPPPVLPNQLHLAVPPPPPPPPPPPKGAASNVPDTEAQTITAPPPPPSLSFGVTTSSAQSQIPHPPVPPSMFRPPPGMMPSFPPPPFMNGPPPLPDCRSPPASMGRLPRTIASTLQAANPHNDDQQNHPNAASGNLPSNQAPPNFPKPGALVPPFPYMGPFAPLPSQLGQTDNSK
ncbi:hypothetical protein OSTOST_19317, partial [Ostertagia ostertagi]